MFTTRFIVLFFSLALTVVGAETASAQNYPNKPIRIVTAPVGGAADFVARRIASGLTPSLGQQVVIDNRAGILQGEIVSKALPDGYTLLVSGGAVWITPLLRKTSFDAVRDFSPISLIDREVNVVAVHPSLPVNSIKELIALAKAKPGALNYTSGGTGSALHLAGELFKAMAGVNIVHVPYKGGGAALLGMVSGDAQMTITDLGQATPYMKQGRLKALAVTTVEPSLLAPGLPTVAASGVPGYEATGMTGIWAPAKTPEGIIKLVNQEVVRYLNQPDVKALFLNDGIEPASSTAGEFAAMIKADIARWSKVIKDAGIRAD